MSKRPLNELETRLHQAALSAAKNELSVKQAEAIIPDASARQNALNFLLGVGLFKSLVDAKGSVSFRAVTKSELTTTKDLNVDEILVLGHIKASRNEGIWTKHLKAKTNLHQTVIDRCLKTLTQKRLIKRVPSVQHPTRKIYILEGLDPSVTLTGGPWYTDNELDTEFIQHLTEACLKFIRDLSFPKRRQGRTEGVLYGLSNSPEYPNAEQIRNSLRKARLTETDLSVEHVEMLLNVLVLDGEIERLPAFGAAIRDANIGGAESSDDSDRPSKKRRKHPNDDRRPNMRKRKKAINDDDESVSGDTSPKKSKRKRVLVSSDSEDMNESLTHMKRKSEKRRKDDREGGDSSDEENIRRKRKVKKSKYRKSTDPSDGESSSDDSGDRSRRSKNSKTTKRSPSPLHIWNNLDTATGGHVYRAIKQERIPFGAAEAPCCQCPSFEFCKDGGPVNPRECVYYGDWLVSGTIAAIEDAL